MLVFHRPLYQTYLHSVPPMHQPRDHNLNLRAKRQRRTSSDILWTSQEPSSALFIVNSVFRHKRYSKLKSKRVGLIYFQITAPLKSFWLAISPIVGPIIVIDPPVHMQTFQLLDLKRMTSKKTDTIVLLNRLENTGLRKSSENLSWIPW